ncbi:MAG: lipoprotein insertase outer membrane protein LolB [Nevskia sp.]|nr:lipoprotein insertase outer membrane protein LolB [Nevskia sp.]
MSLRRLGCALLLGAAGAMLGGCATVEPAPSLAGNSEQAQRNWDARRAALEQVHDFSLQGRLAESGLVSFGGDLSWIQNGSHFQARFYGPLGVGALAIEGEPGDMEVRAKDGTYRTGVPEVLMQEKFGWSMPVDGLRYWVLGLPAPGAGAALQLDDGGHILSLRQNGWQLDYAEYQNVAGLDLPRKFALSDPQRRFRVFIDTWSDVR